MNNQLKLFDVTPSPQAPRTFRDKVAAIEDHFKSYGCSIKQIAMEAKAKYDRGELYK